MHYRIPHGKQNGTYTDNGDIDLRLDGHVRAEIRYIEKGIIAELVTWLFGSSQQPIGTIVNIPRYIPLSAVAVSAWAA